MKVTHKLSELSQQSEWTLCHVMSYVLSIFNSKLVPDAHVLVLSVLSTIWHPVSSTWKAWTSSSRHATSFPSGSSDSRPLAPSCGRARYAPLRLRSASSFSARFLVLRQVELHVSGEPVLVSGRVQRASDGSRMRRTETWNGWWWRCRSTTVRLHSHLHV